MKFWTKTESFYSKRDLDLQGVSKIKQHLLKSFRGKRGYPWEPPQIVQPPLIYLPQRERRVWRGECESFDCEGVVCSRGWQDWQNVTPLGKTAEFVIGSKPIGLLCFHPLTSTSDSELPFSETWLLEAGLILLYPLKSIDSYRSGSGLLVNSTRLK